MRMFKNRVLRRIFERRRDEMTGEQSKLHNEELNVLYSSKYCSGGKMRCVGHVACMGERIGVYRVLVGKQEGKTQA
jgi:hypothetical protein